MIFFALMKFQTDVKLEIHCASEAATNGLLRHNPEFRLGTDFLIAFSHQGQQVRFFVTHCKNMKRGCVFATRRSRGAK